VKSNLALRNLGFRRVVVVVESSEESNLLKGMVILFQRGSNEGQTASGHKRRFGSTITADADAKGVNEAVSNDFQKDRRCCS